MGKQQQLNNAYTNPLGFEGLEPDLEQQTALMRADMQKTFDLCVQMKQTFSTPHGKKVLAFLRAATIEAATWSPSLAQASSIEAANAHAYAREGQNALIRDIENKMGIAEKFKTVDDLLENMGGNK